MSFNEVSAKELIVLFLVAGFCWGIIYGAYRKGKKNIKTTM